MPSLSQTTKIKTGAAQKLADALASEQQRHADTLGGIVDAAKTRKGEVVAAQVELSRESTQLDSVIEAVEK